MNNNILIFGRKNHRNFQEILSDPHLRYKVQLKIETPDYLILRLKDDTITSHMALAYQDQLLDKETVFPDFSPKIGIDYTPEYNPEFEKRRNEFQTT